MNLINNLKVKGVWLPSEYFETNRIKYDSDWYNDFYLELE